MFAARPAVRGVLLALRSALVAESLVFGDRARDGVGLVPRLQRNGIVRRFGAGPIGRFDRPLHRVRERVRLPASTPSSTISWPWTTSFRTRCPTFGCPMNSAVSRALRSRDQRRLGAPDNGMRRLTPTCPTGSGSPLAGPTMRCSSAMFPPRTSNGDWGPTRHEPCPQPYGWKADDASGRSRPAEIRSRWPQFRFAQSDNEQVS